MPCEASRLRAYLPGFIEWSETSRVDGTEPGRFLWRGDVWLWYPIPLSGENSIFPGSLYNVEFEHNFKNAGVFFFRLRLSSNGLQVCKVNRADCLIRAGCLPCLRFILLAQYILKLSPCQAFFCSVLI